MTHRDQFSGRKWVIQDKTDKRVGIMMKVNVLIFVLWFILNVSGSRKIFYYRSSQLISWVLAQLWSWGFCSIVINHQLWGAPMTKIKSAQKPFISLRFFLKHHLLCIGSSNFLCLAHIIRAILRGGGTSIFVQR